MPVPRSLAALAAAALLILSCGAATAQDGGSGTSYFDIDSLNAGLGPAREIDRETPQAAVESFQYFASRDDFGNAAHLLNLSRLEPDRQRQDGPKLARQLKDIIERKVWIDWAELPDRPDGLDPAASSNDPLAGQPRRSLRLETIRLDGRPVPIRLERVKPAGGEPVWVFASQTVDNIAALHALYGPRAFERGLPDWSKRPALFGLPIWELLALPLIVLLALGAGVVVYRIATAVSRRFDRGIAGSVVSELALPAALIGAGMVLYWATKTLFVFSVAIDTFVTPTLLVLLFGGGLIVFVRIIDLIIDRTLGNDVAELEKPENADARAFQTNISAFRRVALVIALLVFVGIVLTRINFLAATGIALVGSAGLLTLVLAFAGRSALSNIMASLQIALSKAAAIGDSVLFDGQWSHVEKINFTYVQLKTWDNRRLVVPVTRFVSEPFENWTKRDPAITKLVELRLNHTADVDALRERFDAFVEESDDILDKKSAQVLVIGHDATGMLVGFYAAAPDPTTGWQMHCRLRETMLRTAAELELDADRDRRFLPAEREIRVADLTGGARRAAGAS
ncbi:mechanosensitive ion channel family protein [Microbaculum marinum]|uniref:Mechanosensitive ion channel domain-containing protein n=1 Tax=Microbaculum marinum TaxID=1764581 RepID=A0AAW9RXD7_9HYPH